MNTALSLPVLFAVATGGATGSVLRYLIGLLLYRYSGAFPVGTFAVNMLGSFLLGLFTQWFTDVDVDQVWRLALTVGFCGGFTTLSTLSAETVTLLQQGRLARAGLYVSVSLTISVLALMAGLAVGRGAR